MFTLFLIFIIIYLSYKLLIKNNDYFDRRGVKYKKPTLLIGNLGPILFRKLTLADNLQVLYNEFKGEKVYGFFNLLEPVYMVRDPEVVKKITVKDFDVFQDHRAMIDETMDPLLGNVLIALKGKKWRDMRATLSPAFTSNKMKQMFRLIEKCAEDLSQYILDELSSDLNKEFEMKEMFSKCTINVIGTCAFGLEIDTFKDPENKFYKISQTLTGEPATQMLKYIGLILSPQLMKLLNVSLLNSATAQFFKKLVKETITERANKNIIRPDMIHLLMQAKAGTLKHDCEDETTESYATAEESDIGKESVKRDWSDDELTAQILHFFAAGFETTSQLLSFTTHELAVNPDIQQRLIDEIDGIRDSVKNGDGKFDYEAIQKLKYMDMVVSESLRKWPPVPATDRYSWKPYTLRVDGFDLFVEKGTLFWIPTYAIHRDPDYFNDPDRFNPERFSTENRSKIKPFTYMPIGNGPRNCIGSRMALMQVKIILYVLLSKFKIKVGSKTQVPLQLSKTSTPMSAEKGFWLSYEIREE